MLRVFSLIGFLFAAIDSHQSGADLPFLNVHIVPHTHDDVGWLKTVDQYYVGSRNEIQRAGVRYVLDTTIQELINDPNKKFVYVEVAFFERWWQEQNDDLKQEVKSLVSNGQLVFINGGWVMNDEACVYFQAVIDQMTLGHRFLNDTFGIQPTIGWSVDPFGHSSQQASAFADMGFNAFVLGRVDNDDRSFRKSHRTLEFVWEPSRSSGPSKQILGAITPDGYYPPSGFCFDDHCDDDSLQDRTDLFDYNLKEKADLFAEEVRNWAEWYRDGEMMLTIGGDFHFSNAHAVFLNLDKLIAYFNQNVDRYKMKLFYSTPVDYFKNRSQDPVPFTIKTDDFFPYGTFDGHGYWVGYFTSRPALKRLAQVSNSHLQICKQLHFFSDVKGDVETLKRALAIAQHHDAISGTEKQHVAYDYARRLSIGNDACDRVVNNAMKKLSGADFVDFRRCPDLNISSCIISQKAESFSVTVYNSKVHDTTEIVRIPVDSPLWSATSSNGISCPIQIYSNVHDQSSSPLSSIYTIVLLANVPALGFTVYNFQQTTDCSFQTSWALPDRTDPEQFVIENENMKVVFNPETGQIETVVNKVDGTKVQLRHYWATYLSHDGHQGPVASGAYIFRPETQEPTPIRPNLTSFRFNRGPIVSQVHMTFGNMIQQTVRIIEGTEVLEIEFTVGAIDVSDGIGKEIVSRYATNITSGDLFWSDSNGREMIERRRNYRKTWPLVNKEPVASNYVPVTTAISINDDEAALFVLTDRSQGGSSLVSGQLELMVHRRTLHDDQLGVAEPINEPGLDGKGLIIRGTHTLLISKPSRAASLHRFHQESIAHPVALLFSPASRIPVQQYSSLQASLPKNIQIVTLEKIDPDRIILRLAHMFSIDEDAVLSRPSQVDLRHVFKYRCIVQIKELNLSANQMKSETSRWSWKTIESNEVKGPVPGEHESDPLVVSLSAMEIRTWEIGFSECRPISLLLPITE